MLFTECTYLLYKIPMKNVHWTLLHMLNHIINIFIKITNKMQYIQSDQF